MGGRVWAGEKRIRREGVRPKNTQGGDFLKKYVMGVFHFEKFENKPEELIFLLLRITSVTPKVRWSTMSNALLASIIALSGGPTPYACNGFLAVTCEN